MSRTAVAIFFGACTLVACITPQGTTKTRAANDFQCPESQVLVTNIGGNSFKAEGCGKTANYNCTSGDSYKGSTTSYTCVPEAQPAAAAPAAPAPAAAAPK